MPSLVLLPEDILVCILKKLEMTELCNVMLTCKYLWSLIVNNNTIWRSFYKDKLMFDNGSQLSSYNCSRISHNWCYGYYKTMVLMNHYVNYMPSLEFYRSEVLLLSLGSELHCYQKNRKGWLQCREPVWSLDVPKVKRHDVRSNDISRFVVQNSIIACGNRDGCVAVYKSHNMYKRPELLCHLKDCHEGGKFEVSAIELLRLIDDTVVITGSVCSSNLLLYKIKDDMEYGNETVINDNSDNATYVSVDSGIRSLSLNKGKDKLAIGLYGYTRPILMDINNPQVVVRAGGEARPREEVRDVQWHDEHTLTYVMHGGALQRLDTRSRQLVRTHRTPRDGVLAGHQANGALHSFMSSRETSMKVYSVRDPFGCALYCVRTDGAHAIVVGSSQYSRCVLFDARRPRGHVQIYFTQKKRSPVYSLHFDSSRLITAVDRGLALLDFDVRPRAAQRRDYSDALFGR